MSLNDLNSLSHTKWNCKYHIVFEPKYRSREFWCRGYYAGTTGKNTSRIAEYIRNQLKEDQMSEQLTMSEVGPFTVGK
ncbi:MAG: hypothetical protein GX264_07335 [Clostridiales bacterium]|jgi:REP element-mobilizing transposase RayT|nr:hypothetical protein [Clostridiales bacterium]